MAWTTAKTWVTGETVTAAMMNTHVRDNEQYLYDENQTRITNANSVGLVASASALLTLSTTWTDMPGATVTLNRTCSWEIHAHYTLFVEGSGDFAWGITGAIAKNGVQYTNKLAKVVSPAGQIMLPGSSIVKEAFSSGDVLKLQGRKEGGSGSSKIALEHTYILAIPSN